VNVPSTRSSAVAAAVHGRDAAVVRQLAALAGDRVEVAAGLERAVDRRASLPAPSMMLTISIVDSVPSVVNTPCRGSRLIEP
jgi:hypothetical protein